MPFGGSVLYQAVEGYLQLFRRSIVASVICSLLMFVVGCGETATSADSTFAAPTLAPTTQAPTSTATVEPSPTGGATSTAEPSPTNAPTVPPAATVDAAASDLPVLSQENAPPTPDPTRQEPGDASQPARIIIPAIGLDLPAVAVGVDEQQVPIVSKHDVGWFTGSSMPGGRSNVILWGHVLRWLDSPTIKAPFERVHELQPGAELTLVTVDGQEHRYKVTQQIQARPEETQLLYPTLSERITLVSCIGDKVIQAGTLTKEFRLVTIAEPVQ